MKTLRDLGEDAVVERLAAVLAPGAGVLVGPGDDCAVIESAARGRVSLLKTDCLVEGVHYEPATPPARVGWKAVARVLSDFAAMAGTPEHLLVTLALPPSRAMRWAEGLYRGMNRCAETFGAAVVGGETSSIPPESAAVISVAASGWARRRELALRSGGQKGDRLYVTGRLGGSLRGSHLTFTPRLEEAAWLAANFPVHAMMDLSDGLGRDLPRLAAASACGFLLDRQALPRNRGVSVVEAIGDGEDYELLLAVSTRTAPRLEREWRVRFPALPLTGIGVLTAPGDGEEIAGGWDHFC